MIPKECKRIAEVDFPVAKVSKSSLLENASRGSHPKGLHLWWARRPLSACRSVLLALLLLDPADPLCPSDYIEKMRSTLLSLHGRPIRWESESHTPEGLRRIVLEFIAEFSRPEKATNPRYVRTARNLVTMLAAGDQPVVCDSFAGGGSIPLEAMRLGCDAIGSDINPLACLILRTELEHLPRLNEDFVAQLDQAGRVIDARFRSRIQEYFAEESPGSNVIAYFWARRAVCESPNCGSIFPLVTNFWLCKKRGNESALRESGEADGRNFTYTVFHPSSNAEVPQATVTNGRGRCPKCGAALANERLRSQLTKDQGGIEQAQMLAVVAQDSTTGKRHYRGAKPDEARTAKEAALHLEKIQKNPNEPSLSPIPDETIPHSELRRVSAPLYGCDKWQDLFLPRQRLSLYFLLEEIKKYIIESGKGDLLPLLTLAFGKVVRQWNSNARWHTKSENVAGAFGRQAIPMTYFFPEQSPLTTSGAGSWSDAVESVSSAARAIVGLGNVGQSFWADASDVPLPSDSVNVWFTDPPYYDAVAYAHLADFFYVWFRRLIPDDPLFTTPLIDKTQECVVDRPHSQSPSQKRSDWFETKMRSAMAEGRRLLAEDGIASVVFAHKTTEGWEAIIAAMLTAGWVITASWPISTERGARLNARDNASLATSVHLICRPRAENAPMGDWADILRELPKRVNDWMERLQGEGIRGADLVFACIGPALEIFSRYRVVETADGCEVKLDQYLEKVWEVVGREALKQVLGTDSPNVYGEDARLTALFLWTLNSSNDAWQLNGNNYLEVDEENDFEFDDSRAKNTNKYALPYDMVRRFCLPLGIRLDNWVGKIVEISKGVVYLVPVKNRTDQLLGKPVSSDLKLTKPRVVRQLSLFDLLNEAEEQEKQDAARHRVEKVTWSRLHQDSVPTLDHVHTAMLLQLQGRSSALRELLFYEKQYRPEFLPLANALSALYPLGSEEKRLLDAMLLALPK